MRLSEDLMKQLKTTGRTQYTTIKGGLDGSLGVFASSLAGPAGFWERAPKITCVLARSEAGDVAYPILIDGRRVILPAIHASCTNQSQSYVLLSDDVEAGLVLAAMSARQQMRGQLIEIHFPKPPAPPANGHNPSANGGGGGSGNGGGGTGLEKTMRDEGRADVYGIYFDFDKDVIRPESAPVIAEIADMMKRNPSWKLKLNGHTDNIGGDAHNLDLSNRRAEAVKRALVAQYGIDPSRLATQGFGATQPRESNDTIEGRARNRRVELVRL
jgi:outer membrane protein OmpA-like peptidoglycan-associated protein